MAGYALSSYFHLSGALAMVIMGLFVGNYKTAKAMSDHTQAYMHKFWELIDVVLNAILFISIAFVLVVIEFTKTHIIIGFLCILIVFITRIIVIYLPKILLPKITGISSNAAKLFVWGGLRGGLSLALVLSLPQSETKDLLLIATYMCVVFSILVQGLTIERFARKLLSIKPEKN